MGFTGFSRAGHRHPTRSQQVITAWVLIVGFLLQPVLAYLVTPIVEHDAHGNQIVICTLKGQKLVTIDNLQLADNQDTEHCSALKLFQMANAVQVSEPGLAPQLTLYAVEYLDQTADHQHHSLHFSAYSTRAPPAIS
ncbi:MAG: hypothetical protein KDI67_06360 [Gammaproteobacteria bacterium]|nr:hypothetical protein [Gammaproteobacteria bacterium]